MKNDELHVAEEIIFKNAWNPHHHVLHAAPPYNPPSAGYLLTWVFGFCGVAVTLIGSIFNALPLMLIGGAMLVLMVGTVFARFGGLIK